MTENRFATELAEVVGANVLRLRARRGMTQEDLAAECGWKGKSVVSRIERQLRVPSLRTIERLADGLDTTPWELIRPTAARAR